MADQDSAARTPFDPLVPMRALDWGFAAVGGLGVAAPVAAVFAETYWWPVLAIPAFFFTALTTLLAGRARTDALAVLGVFLGCVLPPAIIFLPTVVGVVVAVPAGLLAAFALLPLVLVLRSAHATPLDDDGEHVAVYAAAWLLTLAIATVGCVPRFHLALGAPGLVVAALLAVFVLVRDAGRATFLSAVRAGRVPGLELADTFATTQIRVHGDALFALRAVRTSGDGPFRRGASSELLGAVRVPRTRIGAALALLVVSVCGVVLVTAA